MVKKSREKTKTHEFPCTVKGKSAKLTLTGLTIGYLKELSVGGGETKKQKHFRPL